MGKKNHHKAATEDKQVVLFPQREVCDCVVYTKHEGTARTLLNIYKSRCIANGKGYDPKACYVEGTELHVVGMPPSCARYFENNPNVRRVETTNLRKIYF